MSKHTPGPWEARSGSHLCIHQANDGGMLARMVYKPFPKAANFSHLQITANARLIAAAPDMYEALKGLLADIEDYQRVNKLGGEGNHWQVIARAAISKAEGQ